MKKSNIKFYDLNESKTEFLFESDAEKAAINEAMRKKPKVYKKIIRKYLTYKLIWSNINDIK